MSDLQQFQEILEVSVSAFMIQFEWFGLMVRPLDFILFTGAVGLLVDLFHMVVMRGTD